MKSLKIILSLCLFLAVSSSVDAQSRTDNSRADELNASQTTTVSKDVKAAATMVTDAPDGYQAESSAEQEARIRDAAMQHSGSSFDAAETASPACSGKSEAEKAACCASKEKAKAKASSKASCMKPCCANKAKAKEPGL